MAGIDDRVAWLVISAAWILGSFGSGAILAALYRHLHPGLSFHKLWAFWTVVVSLVAIVILLIV